MGKCGILDEQHKVQRAHLAGWGEASKQTAKISFRDRFGEPQLAVPGTEGSLALEWPGPYKFIADAKTLEGFAVARVHL